MICHFFTRLESLGGVESILRVHMALDRESGIDSTGVFACEQDAPLRSRHRDACGLGIRGWHSFAQVAAQFQRHAATANTVVFHNLWGFRHVEGSLPDHVLRIGMLHVDGPVSRWAVERNAARLDHVICVSGAIATHAKNYLPEGCVTSIEYPIQPPPGFSRPPRRNHVIGYCGRLNREQKRVDRLPLIADEVLRRTKRSVFEICGEGPERSALEVGLPPATVFHGRLSGSDYWRTLASWGTVLFSSDFEGTPIALLEALSQGVIPVYPRIGSGGEDYVGRVSEKLLYPAGDPAKAAEVLAWLDSLPKSDLETLRSRAVAAVRENTPASYLHCFQSVLCRAVKRDLAPKPRPPLLIHDLPLAVLARIDPRNSY